MNWEIWTVAAQFLFLGILFEIFGIMSLQCGDIRDPLSQLGQVTLNSLPEVAPARHSLFLSGINITSKT
jgi:hypothetical protein